MKSSLPTKDLLKKGLADPVSLFAIFVLVVSIFVGAFAVSNRELNLNIGEKAAPPSDESSCGGCAGDGQAWSWNKKRAECKKVASAECKKKEVEEATPKPNVSVKDKEKDACSGCEGGLLLVWDADEGTCKKRENAQCSAQENAQEAQSKLANPCPGVCVTEGSCIDQKDADGNNLNLTNATGDCLKGICCARPIKLATPTPSPTPTTIADNVCLAYGETCTSGNSYADLTCPPRNERCGTPPLLSPEEPQVPAQPDGGGTPAVTATPDYDTLAECIESIHNTTLCIQKLYQTVGGQTPQSQTPTTTPAVSSLVPDAPINPGVDRTGANPCRVCRTSTSCTNYKGGDVFVGAANTLYQCDGNNGKLVNATALGFTFNDVTVSSGLSENDLTVAYINLNTLTYGAPAATEKSCGGTGGAQIPSGNVAIGAGNQRQKCNNGRWEACPKCALTIVPKYLENDPTILAEQQAKLDAFGNAQSAYDLAVETCRNEEGVVPPDCHAQAVNQAVGAIGTSEITIFPEEIRNILDENYKLGNVLQNTYYPTLDNLKVCLSENDNNYSLCAGYQHELNRTIAQNGIGLSSIDSLNTEGYNSYLISQISDPFYEAKDAYQNCILDQITDESLDCNDESLALLQDSRLSDTQRDQIESRYQYFRPASEICKGKTVCNQVAERYNLLKDAGYSVTEIEAFERSFRDYLNQIALSGSTGILQLCLFVAPNTQEAGRCSEESEYLERVVSVWLDPRIADEFTEKLAELTRNSEINNVLAYGSNQDIIAACKETFSAVSGQRRLCGYVETAKQALLNSLPEDLRPEVITASGGGGRTTVLLEGQAACNNQGQCIAAVQHGDNLSADPVSLKTGLYACPRQCAVIGAGTGATTQRVVNINPLAIFGGQSPFSAETVSSCLSDSVVQTITRGDTVTTTACGSETVCRAGACLEGKRVLTTAPGNPDLIIQKFCEVGKACNDIYDPVSGKTYSATILKSTENGQTFYWEQNTNTALDNEIYSQTFAEIYGNKDITNEDYIYEYTEFRILHPGASFSDFQISLERKGQQIIKDAGIDFFDALLASEVDKDWAKVVQDDNRWLIDGIVNGRINYDEFKTELSAITEQLRSFEDQGVDCLNEAQGDINNDSETCRVEYLQTKDQTLNAFKDLIVTTYRDTLSLKDLSLIDSRISQVLTDKGLAVTPEAIIAYQQQQLEDGLYLFNITNPNLFSSADLNDPAVLARINRNPNLKNLYELQKGYEDSFLTLASALEGEVDYSAIVENYENNKPLRDVIWWNNTLGGAVVDGYLAIEQGGDKLGDGDLWGAWDIARGNVMIAAKPVAYAGTTIYIVANCVLDACAGNALLPTLFTATGIFGTANAAGDVARACDLTEGSGGDCAKSVVNLGINAAFLKTGLTSVGNARLVSQTGKTLADAAIANSEKIIAQQQVKAGTASFLTKVGATADSAALATTRFVAPVWFTSQGLDCFNQPGANPVECGLMVGQGIVSALSWNKIFQRNLLVQQVAKGADVTINSLQAAILCAATITTGNTTGCEQALGGAFLSGLQPLHPGQAAQDQSKSAFAKLTEARQAVYDLYDASGNPRPGVNEAALKLADTRLVEAIYNYSVEESYVRLAQKQIEGDPSQWTLAQKTLIEAQNAYLLAQKRFAETQESSALTTFDAARIRLMRLYAHTLDEARLLTLPKNAEANPAALEAYNRVKGEFEAVAKKFMPGTIEYDRSFAALESARSNLELATLKPAQREIQLAINGRKIEAVNTREEIALTERQLAALKNQETAKTYRDQLVDRFIEAQKRGDAAEVTRLGEEIRQAEEIVTLTQNGGKTLEAAVNARTAKLTAGLQKQVILDQETGALTQAKTNAGKLLARISEAITGIPTADQILARAKSGKKTTPSPVAKFFFGTDESPTALGRLIQRFGSTTQAEVALEATFKQKFPKLEETLAKSQNVKDFISQEGNKFRLNVSGAEGELAAEVARFNKILDNFEADFGNPYDYQVEKLVLTVKNNKIIIQLDAGQGKTQVLAPITAALEGTSILHLATKTDALDTVKQINARRAFFTSTYDDFRVFYYDSTRGFLEIDPTKPFDLEKASQAKVEDVQAAMEKAAESPENAGVLVITQTADLAWGTIRGRQGVGGTADGLLFKMVNKNFSLVGDEAGVTAGSRFSVSLGDEETLRNLTNPKLLAGIENGQRILELSAKVEAIPSLVKFRQQVLDSVGSDHRANFVSVEKNGNLYTTWIPADEQIIRDSYREIIQNSLASLPEEAAIVRSELGKLLDLAKVPDLDTFNKAFSDLLQRTDIVSAADKTALAELTYQRADLHARWEILFRIPGNDFGQEGGLIVLRKKAETTGEQFQEVARRIALQEEGAKMMNALGLKPEDNAPLVPVAELSLSPDSSSITMADFYKQYAIRVILFDATPLTAEAQLGIARAGEAESAPAPRIFLIDSNANALIDEGLGYIDPNKGLAIVLNAESQSFDTTRDALIDKRKPEYVAITRYSRTAAGELQPQYYLEKVTYNPDGTFQRNTLGRIEDLDGWNAAIQNVVPTLENPSDLLIVFEGRDRAVDVKVKDALHRNIEWVQLCDSQCNGQELTQGWKRNRVPAEMGDAATWTPELITEHSQYDLWIVADPQVAKYNGETLTRDNVVDYFNQRTQLDIARYKAENISTTLARQSESLLAEVKTHLLENRPTKVTKAQIESIMTELTSDAQRVNLARSSDLSLKPQSGEAIANDIYFRGLAAHEQRLNYLNQIQARLNLSQDSLVGLRALMGVDKPFLAKDVFNDVIKGRVLAPEEVAAYSGPGKEVLTWAQGTSLETLNSLALFRQGLDETTVVARAKVAETLSQKLLENAKQVTTPLTETVKKAAKFSASMVGAARNWVANLRKPTQTAQGQPVTQPAGIRLTISNAASRVKLAATNLLVAIRGIGLQTPATQPVPGADEVPASSVTVKRPAQEAAKPEEKAPVAKAPVEEAPAPAAPTQATTDELALAEAQRTLDIPPGRDIETGRFSLKEWFKEFIPLVRTNRKTINDLKRRVGDGSRNIADVRRAVAGMKLSQKAAENIIGGFGEIASRPETQRANSPIWRTKGRNIAATFVFKFLNATPSKVIEKAVLKPGEKFLNENGTLNLKAIKTAKIPVRVAAWFGFNWLFNQAGTGPWLSNQLTALVADPNIQHSIDQFFVSLARRSGITAWANLGTKLYELVHPVSVDGAPIILAFGDVVIRSLFDPWVVTRVYLDTAISFLTTGTHFFRPFAAYDLYRLTWGGGFKTFVPTKLLPPSLTAEQLTAAQKEVNVRPGYDVNTGRFSVGAWIKDTLPFVASDVKSLNKIKRDFAAKKIKIDEVRQKVAALNLDQAATANILANFEAEALKPEPSFFARKDTFFFRLLNANPLEFVERFKTVFFKDGKFQIGEVANRTVVFWRVGWKLLGDSLRVITTPYIITRVGIDQIAINSVVGYFGGNPGSWPWYLRPFMAYDIFGRLPRWKPVNTVLTSLDRFIAQKVFIPKPSLTAEEKELFLLRGVDTSGQRSAVRILLSYVPVIEIKLPNGKTFTIHTKARKAYEAAKSRGVTPEKPAEVPAPEAPKELTPEEAPKEEPKTQEYEIKTVAGRDELTITPSVPVEDKPETLFSPEISKAVTSALGRKNNVVVKVKGVSYQAISNQYFNEPKFRFDSETAADAFKDNRRYKIYFFENNSVLIYPGSHRMDISETDIAVSASPLEEIQVHSGYDFQIWAPALATRMILAGFPADMGVTFNGYSTNNEEEFRYIGQLGILAKGNLSGVRKNSYASRYLLPVLVNGKEEKFVLGDLIRFDSDKQIIITGINKLADIVDIRVLPAENHIPQNKRLTIRGFEEYLNQDSNPNVIRRYNPEKAVYYPSEVDKGDAVGSNFISQEFENVLESGRDFIAIYSTKSYLGDRDLIWSDKETSHIELIKSNQLFEEEVPVSLQFDSSRKTLLLTGDVDEFIRLLTYLGKHKHFDNVSASFTNKAGKFQTITGNAGQLSSQLQQITKETTEARTEIPSERALVVTNPDRQLAMPMSYYMAKAAELLSNIAPAAPAPKTTSDVLRELSDAGKERIVESVNSLDENALVGELVEIAKRDKLNPQTPLVTAAYVLVASKEGYTIAGPTDADYVKYPNPIRNAVQAKAIAVANKARPIYQKEEFIAKLESVDASTVTETELKALITQWNQSSYGAKEPYTYDNDLTANNNYFLFRYHVRGEAEVTTDEESFTPPSTPSLEETAAEAELAQRQAKKANTGRIWKAGAGIGGALLILLLAVNNILGFHPTIPAVINQPAPIIIQAPESAVQPPLIVQMQPEVVAPVVNLLPRLSNTGNPYALVQFSQDYHELLHADEKVAPTEIVIHWDAQGGDPSSWTVRKTVNGLAGETERISVENPILSSDANGTNTHIVSGTVVKTNRPSNAHFAVGPDGVIQLLPMYEDYVTMSYGSFGYPTVVNIEMAGQYFTANNVPESEVNNTLDLVIQLMLQYKIPFSGIVGHYERDNVGDDLKEFDRQKPDPGPEFLAHFQNLLATRLNELKYDLGQPTGVIAEIPQVQVVALNTLSPYAGFASIRTVAPDGRNNWNQEEWLPIDASSLPDFTNLSAPEKLTALINYLNIENPNNLRYAMDGNDTTFCNIFVGDVTSALGVPLPRWISGTKTNANFLSDWLADASQGGALGWQQVSAQEAQEFANQGMPVVGAIQRTGRPGHVFIVTPGKGANVGGIFYPTIANVGITNFVGGNANQVLMGQDQPTYYVNTSDGYQFTAPTELAYQPALALLNPSAAPLLIVPLASTKFVRYATAATQNINGFFGRLHKAAVGVDDFVWGKVVPKAKPTQKPNIILPPIPPEKILDGERTTLDDLKEVIIDERGEKDATRIFALAEEVYGGLNSPDEKISRLARIIKYLQKKGLLNFEKGNRNQQLGIVLAMIDRMDRNFKKFQPQLQAATTAHENLVAKYGRGVLYSDRSEPELGEIGVVILTDAEMDAINPDKRHATRAFYKTALDTFFIRYSATRDDPESTQRTSDHEVSHMLNDYFNAIQLKPQVERYFAGRPVF